MTARQALLWGAILLALTLISVFTIDMAVARSVQPSVATTRTFANPFTGALEFLFAFELSKFATGAAIVLASLVLFAFARWRGLAWLLLFVGLSHLTTRLIAGVLKNVFLRSRPYEAVVTGDRWFTDGSSFPSGHSAHFWGLFFALAMAFPKLRWPALALALLVCAARVMVNDHFVGDVLGSGAIAAFVCAAYAPLVHRGRATMAA